MWSFGGGGGGNPWLQGLVQRIGGARGGGGGAWGGQRGGGPQHQQPAFGVGGMFSRMGQGWGMGDRSMGQPGSPNSMSFAPQQQPWGGMNMGGEPQGGGGYGGGERRRGGGGGESEREDDDV